MKWVSMVVKINMIDIKQQLCDLFEENAEEILLQWITKMQESGLVKDLTKKEIEERGKAKSDTIIKCLKTGTYTDAEVYAAGMAQKAVREAMTVDQIISLNEIHFPHLILS